MRLPSYFFPLYLYSGEGEFWPLSIQFNSTFTWSAFYNLGGLIRWRPSNQPRSKSTNICSCRVCVAWSLTYILVIVWLDHTNKKLSDPEGQPSRQGIDQKMKLEPTGSIVLDKINQSNGASSVKQLFNGVSFSKLSMKTVPPLCVTNKNNTQPALQLDLTTFVI